MIPTQVPLTSQGAPVPGPAITKTRAAQDGPAREGSILHGFAEVLFRQPSGRDGKEAIAPPSVPDQLHATGVADTEGPVGEAVLTEEIRAEVSATLKPMDDRAALASGNATSVPVNRSVEQDLNSAAPSEKGATAPGGAGAVFRTGPEGSKRSAVGVGAMPGPINMSPGAGDTPAVHPAEPASAKPARPSGADQAPVTAHQPIHPRTGSLIRGTTKEMPAQSAPAGAEPAVPAEQPAWAAQAPPARYEPRGAASRDLPPPTATLPGPVGSAAQAKAQTAASAATPSAPPSLPVQTIPFPTEDMVRPPVADWALPGSDLAAGSNGERPAAGTPAGSGMPSFVRATPAQIAQQIAVSVSASEGGQTDLRLNPEELGRVRLSLSGGEGILTVSITAERPETADLLRRHIDSLAREFAAMGYEDVGFHFEGETSRDRDQGRGGPQGHAAPGQAMPDAHEPPAQGPALLLGGGLDLKL